ncbi:hypothetical protein GCM10017783_15320 [Deinococcus piscis]|uniref:ASCH domain-containing protein n=1 Tax=Deinococcus piscis TaxID=394230 RepID=A0ABQ3K656_9DEIO|nr:ASCH domain-containing protein [Deinococcus piscis]GHG03671.1 hypothetical protein GCM10017783_15320 [Deinococcus piscis]
MTGSLSLPHLHFHPDYRAAVQAGHKRTTVRWGESAAVGPVLLLFGDDPQGWPAHITHVESLALTDLTDAHAQADGFQNRAELLARLRFHYPTLPADAQVSVVHFRLD